MRLKKKPAFYLLMLFMLAPACWLTAAGQSIYFRPSLTWNEALKQATKENKLVFVDVYTDWCGPCKNMEENVFSLKNVADFYNIHFLSYKLDAEKGEGIGLKDKYGVKVYPTYLFIDPHTGNVVHRSTSRQDPEVFIATGQAALDPARQSVKLVQQYHTGVRTPVVLSNYADYLSSCYQREALDTLVRQYLRSVSYRLSDTLAWHLFSRYRQGSQSNGFSYLLANRGLLSRQYGLAQVDDKIREGYEYDLNRLLMQGIYSPDRFDQAAYGRLLNKVSEIDFTGKELMLHKMKVLDLYRRQQYEEAASLADKIAGYPGIAKEDLLDFYNQLVFLSRNNEEAAWIGRALNYARYIAYNDEARRARAEIHYAYAAMLEKYLKLSSATCTGIQTPVIRQPEFGATEYSLRPADLKPKPSGK